MRLIDADELKDRVGYIEEEYGHIMEEINNAPTVDAVERKRGEWVDNGLDSIGFMGIEYRLQKCSNCGETIAKAPMQRLPNFCSNCGADMRTKETDRGYERSVEQLEHDMLYEPTYNPDDGSM